MHQFFDTNFLEQHRAPNKNSKMLTQNNVLKRFSWTYLDIAWTQVVHNTAYIVGTPYTLV